MDSSTSTTGIPTNPESQDVLCTYGDAVKAAADGTVSGYLVRYSTVDDPDLTGEYFTEATYFGKHKGDGVDGLLHHGYPLDPRLKAFSEHIFEAPLKVEPDEIGLFASVVLNLRNKYEASIHAEASKGHLSWSSGAGSHMVRTADDGEILRWPIIEGSLTPTPAEPRNRAFAAKSLQTETPADLVKSMLKSIKAMSTEDKLEQINRSFWQQFEQIYDSAWIARTFLDDGYVIAQVGQRYYQIPFTATESDGIFSVVFEGDLSSWTQVEERREWIPAKAVFMKSLAKEIPSLEAGGQSRPSAPATVKNEPGRTAPLKHNQPQKIMEPNTQVPATEAAPTQQAPNVPVYTEAQMKAYVENAAKTAVDVVLHATRSTPNPGFAAPNLNLKTKPGVTATGAIAAWYRGDIGGVKGFITGEADSTTTNDSRLWGQPLVSIKASNDTDMNIGTAADGGNAVPTGHYNAIIERMTEKLLDVGVSEIPGRGTTVNVPIDNEDDGEFVLTAEAAAYDRDAPAIGQKAMTLAKYTKNIEMSHELMDDEDSKLLAFVERWVGRGMAKTRNNLLVTEVTTNGTSLLTTASATVLAAGELEDVPNNDDLSFYLGEGNDGGHWIVRPSTFGAIQKITGSDRFYAESPGGSREQRSLLGFPVRRSNKVAAYGTTANKFALFGNFESVGVRSGNTIEFLRNPFIKGSNGQVVFHYHFRTVYTVLQAKAVGYIEHA